MPLQEELELQGNWLFKFRGTLPIILLLGGLIYYVWTEKYGHRPFPEDSIGETLYIYFCLAVSMLGFAIRVYVVGQTPYNTSGRNTKEQIADTINKTGLYSVVRHPLYVGNYFMWLGVGLLTASVWFVAAFTLIYWLYYERIMFAEEQFLRKKFGAAYLDWSSKTPAFIPNFSLFKKCPTPFNWRKVLSKEKTGFAALFIVFFLYYCAGEYEEGAKPKNVFLLAASISGIVIYLIIKILIKKTNWFDKV